MMSEERRKVKEKGKRIFGREYSICRRVVWLSQPSVPAYIVTCHSKTEGIQGGDMTPIPNPLESERKMPPFSRPDPRDLKKSPTSSELTYVSMN